MSKPTYLSPSLNPKGTNAVSVATIRSLACAVWYENDAKAAVSAVNKSCRSFMVRYSSFDAHRPVLHKRMQICNASLVIDAYNFACQTGHGVRHRFAPR